MKRVLGGFLIFGLLALAAVTAFPPFRGPRGDSLQETSSAITIFKQNGVVPAADTSIPMVDRPVPFGTPRRVDTVFLPAPRPVPVRPPRPAVPPAAPPAAPPAPAPVPPPPAPVPPPPAPVPPPPAPVPAPGPPRGLPAGAACTNEPTEMTYRNQRSFDAKVEEGWTDRGGEAFSIVTDPTAPVSPPNVGQAKYPPGFLAGRGPIQTKLTLPAGLRTLYLCTWIKISAFWDQNDAGMVKSIFFAIGNAPGKTENRVYSGLRGPAGTSGRLSAEIDFQNMIVTPGGTAHQRISWNGTANVNPAASLIPRGGPWKKWEILLVANTPGQYDGQATWWIDGVKVGQYTAIGYSEATETGAGNTWKFVNWNPTYGGSGAPVPAPGQYQWYDHFYVSGKP